MEQCQKSQGFIAIFYNSIFFHKTQKMHHQKSQLSNIEWRRRQRRWEEEEKEGKNVLEDRERCANWTNIGASLLFQSKLKGSFIFGRFISKSIINMLSYSMLDAFSANLFTESIKITIFRDFLQSTSKNRVWSDKILYLLSLFLRHD